MFCKIGLKMKVSKNNNNKIIINILEIQRGFIEQELAKWKKYAESEKLEIGKMNLIL